VKNNFHFSTGAITQTSNLLQFFHYAYTTQSPPPSCIVRHYEFQFMQITLSLCIHNTITTPLLHCSSLNFNSHNLRNNHSRNKIFVHKSDYIYCSKREESYRFKSTQRRCKAIERATNMHFRFQKTQHL